MTLQIDLLYTEDCTSWQTADQILRQVLADLNLDYEITYWQVSSDRKAIEWGFAGSPSIFVNGRDLFPVGSHATYGLTLRSYITEEGVSGHPSYAMLERALRELE